MGVLERVQESAAEIRIGPSAERRALEVPWRPWDSRYVPFGAGGPAHPSEFHHSMESALRLSPLYAGARLLADMVASLPLRQYRSTSGTDSDVILMPTGQLFQQPAAYGTIYDWLHMCVTSLVLTGNAWGLITARDGYGYPTMIEWLPPERVSCVEDQEQPWNPMRTRIYFYGVKMNREDLFHVRAFTVPGKVEGLSPLRLFMELIEQGKSALSYGATWYKAGGWPPGTFQNMEIEVDSESADEIRRRLTRSIKMREPLVYGRDWEYKPVAVPPSEAQFIEAMQLNATQIAAILGLPPERIGGARGDSLTYSTQEQESISLLTDTLRPWLVRLETAFFNIIPQAQYVRFNSAAMLKTTTETRYNIYRTSRDIGVQTANEIRKLEELPKLPGKIGDDPLPLQVLVAMARGIKEIPRSMEELVEVAPTDVASMASNEKIAANRPQPVMVGPSAAPAAPGGTSTSTAAPTAGSAGNPDAAAAGARARWQGDYSITPEEIRALMNGNGASH